MDEPTSVLTPQEVARLFATLRRLTDEGMSILYISHKLDEIMALCEHATILRNGRKIATVRVAEQSAASLAALMMGEELQAADHSSRGRSDRVCLQIDHLDLPAADPLGISLKNISLQVNHGEIVGLAGVAGNGQEELLKAINGELTTGAGHVYVGGVDIGQTGPNARRKLGLVSVPEKRLGHGAVPNMNLVDNSLLTANTRIGLVNRILINYTKTAGYARNVIDGFDVRTPGEAVTAASLSGGNLQKFIVGRELSQSPELIVVAQPTWGVDAGAAQSIRAALRELANRGAAVLVISQDLDELMEISDRIGAICAGKVSPLYPVDEVNNEKVGLLMAGVEQ